MLRSIDFCLFCRQQSFSFTLFAAIEMLFYYTHTFVFLFVWPQTQVLTSNKVICTCELCKETRFRLFLHVVDLIRGHYRPTLMMANFDWFSRCDIQLLVNSIFDFALDFYFYIAQTNGRHTMATRIWNTQMPDHPRLSCIKQHLCLCGLGGGRGIGVGVHCPLSKERDREKIHFMMAIKP